MVYEAAVIMAYSIASFLLMHFGIQLGKSENKLYKSLQMIFVIFSMFLILETISIAKTMAVENSAGEATLNLLDSVIVAFTYFLLFFVFIFVIIFIIAIWGWFSSRKARFTIPST